MSQSAVTDAFSAYSNADCICTTICEEFRLRISIQVACSCGSSGGAPTPAGISMFSMGKLFTHSFFYLNIIVLHLFFQPTCMQCTPILFRSNSTFPTSVRLCEIAIMVRPGLCFMVA